jgi:hypothetical protein
MDGAPRLDDLIDALERRHPDGNPLASLADAVPLGEYLGELGDHLIGHFVDRARHSGASWTQIGKSLGTTKQAAQKRFVPKRPDAAGETDIRIFAKYDAAARVAVVQSQEEARQAGHDKIQPGHLILALLCDPQSMSARVIDSLGLSTGAVGEVVRICLGPPAGEVPASIPFSPQSRKAIELTHREAVRLEHDHVGSEHLLLGVLALGDKDLVPALAGAGLTFDLAEQAVLGLLSA